MRASFFLLSYLLVLVGGTGCHQGPSAASLDQAALNVCACGEQTESLAEVFSALIEQGQIDSVKARIREYHEATENMRRCIGDQARTLGMDSTAFAIAVKPLMRKACPNRADGLVNELNRLIPDQQLFELDHQEARKQLDAGQ